MYSQSVPGCSSSPRSMTDGTDKRYSVYKPGFSAEAEAKLNVHRTAFTPLDLDKTIPRPHARMVRSRWARVRRCLHRRAP
jgi:hypothetical protein